MQQIAAADYPVAEKAIAELLKNSHAATILAVAVKDGKIVWEGAYGQSDVTRGIKAKPDTMIRVASISKTFTATALMTLFEQGKFQLNEDISTALGYKVRNPNYPDTPITYLQLLTHTSSIVDSDSYGSLINATFSGTIPSVKEFLVPGGKYYSKSNFGSYKPGSGTFNYSNFCFGLLGTLVEKLSGKRFDIFVRENVLSKLKIRGSFNIQDIADINKVAVCYRYNASGPQASTDNFGGVKPAAPNLSSYKPGTNAMYFGPQGGLRVSARDLAAFMLMFLNKGTYGDNQILKPETVSLMLEKHWEGNGFGGLYKKKGLGIHITDDFVPGVEMYGHVGIAYGIRSDMYFSPAKNSGMAFILNGANPAQSGVYTDAEERLAQIIASEILGL